MFDTRAVISTTNKSDEIKCDLCGKKMIFKNLYRHYNVVHNQTYRKQEKQKTGPKKKKNNEKDNDKKKPFFFVVVLFIIFLVRKKKGEFIYVNREVTKFQRRLAILNYFKTVHLKQYIYVTHMSLN